MKLKITYFTIQLFLNIVLIFMLTIVYIFAGIFSIYDSFSIDFLPKMFEETAVLPILVKT